MALDTDRVTTVTFDSYSTLVDVNSSARVLEGLVDDPDAVARTWRAKALSYSAVADDLDAYDTYFEMHRLGLQYALEAEGVEATPGRLDDLMGAYHDLDPFADVREGLERLVELGYEPWILSNGDPAMLDSLVASIDAGDLLAGTISADEIRTFKPDANLYRHAAGRTGTPIDEVLHVAAAAIDVKGAIHAGMQGGWLHRTDDPWDPLGPEPDVVVETVPELADLLA
ncbi:MAG: haloacid dehalogenase type II [Haloarculaceae archaeon]